MIPFHRITCHFLLKTPKLNLCLLTLTVRCPSFSTWLSFPKTHSLTLLFVCISYRHCVIFNDLWRVRTSVSPSCTLSYSKVILFLLSELCNLTHIHPKIWWNYRDILDRWILSHASPFNYAFFFVNSIKIIFSVTCKSEQYQSTTQSWTQDLCLADSDISFFSVVSIAILLRPIADLLKAERF